MRLYLDNCESLVKETAKVRCSESLVKVYGGLILKKLKFYLSTRNNLEAV